MIELKHLAKLNELDLSCNNITSFTNITKLLNELKSLVTLNLFSNPIQNIHIDGNQDNIGHFQNL